MMLLAVIADEEVVAYDLSFRKKSFDVIPDHLRDDDDSSPLRIAKVNDEQFAIGWDEGISIHSCRGGKNGQELGGELRRVFALEGVGPLPGETFGRLVAGGSGGNLVVFHLKTSAFLHRLSSPPRETFAVRCVPEWNHEVFVAGSHDVAIRRYDLKQGVVLSKFPESTGRQLGEAVWGVDVGLERCVIFSVSDNGKAKAWSRDSLQCMATLDLAGSAGSCLYAEEYHSLFVGTARGRVEIWDCRKTTTRVHEFSPSSHFRTFGIARLTHSRFASIGKELSFWRSDGKILKTIRNDGRTGYPGRTPSYGVCTMGTPCDRPRAAHGVVDFAERCRVIVEAKEGEGGDLVPSFLVVSGSQVVVSCSLIRLFGNA